VGLLALGKRIAADLDSHDFLGRWMAHYIAERLAMLEILEEEDRDREQDAIANLIVQLWTNRRGAPLRNEPLASIEAVERALERLDPHRPAWGYFRQFELRDAPSEAEIAVLAPLQMALSLDRVVGDLVRNLVAYAASIAQSDDAEWLTTVREAGQFPERRLRNLIAITGDYKDAAESPSPASRPLRDIAIAAERCIEFLAKIRDAVDDAVESNFETEVT
jgi:hypothetical protein